MIPSNSIQPPAKQEQFVGFDNSTYETLSKEEALGRELFASLNEHVSVTKRLTGGQLFAWLTIFDEDCQKVHVFCQKVLNHQITVNNKLLEDMIKPLLQVATQLENIDKKHHSKAADDVLDKLRFEIREINETIQLKSYFEYREKIQVSLQAWDEELQSVKNGGIIDFSSKNHLEILENCRGLIFSCRQLMKQGVSSALQKQLLGEIKEELKIVAKAQKEMTGKINEYFKKYLQCAKNDLQNSEKETQEFQESFAVFEYFSAGLTESLEGLGSISAEIKKELVIIEHLKLPFSKEINDIFTTLEKNQKALMKISANEATTPFVTKKTIKHNIDVAQSWDSLQIRHTFRFQYPQMIAQVDVDEAMRALSGWHFQQLPPNGREIELGPSTWKLNSLWNITVAALYCLGASGQNVQTSTVVELEADTLNKGLQVSHKVEPMNRMALPEPTAKVDVVVHDREPLKKLRQEVALAERTLRASSSSFCALQEWPHVDDRCYEVAGLEKNIARLMDEARYLLSQEDKEVAKCGPKHLNLIKMAQLVHGLKLEGIVVPIPHGIPSDRVEQFLRKLAPEIFEEWAKLGTLYEKFTGKTPFLEEADAKMHLQAIDQAIEKVFLALGDNEALFQELIPPDFREWLKTIEASKNFLMVRSTGSEDSRETANAGGNVSRNYVSLTASSLAKAMGDVIRSYFGYASLQNRINAKVNPFKSELKMAVTVQELIGEPIGGSSNPAEIPISLVLFSSEPLYVNGEEFRVMRMSIAYGHGESVVGNQGIATDTALVLISQAHPDKLYILYNNKVKPERLAPILTSEGIKLGKVPNPPSMQNRPALNEALLHRLYLWGVLGEKFFDNHPTDMEIVIKGGVVFPVQAREINRPDLLPTYVDSKKVASLLQNPIIQKINGDVIVPGKASVVMIEHTEELLFVPTLENAEKLFQKDVHKVVDVTRPEPDNSHPVVNFSGLGTPCLVTPYGVPELLKQVDKNHIIVVDVQTGVLNLWDTRLGSIDACISEGFAVHPAKIAVSLPLAATLPIRQEGQKVPQDVKDLILEITRAATQEVAVAKLKELRQHGWIYNVKQREQELRTHLQQLKFVPHQLWQGLTLMTQLIEKMEAAFEEAEAVLVKSSQERFHSLFHVKVIESLIINIPQAGRSLGQYTVIDIDPLQKDLKALVEYQKSLSHPAHFADLFMLGSQGIVPAVEVEWRALLKEFEALVESRQISQEQFKQFKQMISTLDSTKMLPTWYSLFFSKVTQSPLTSQEKFNQLLESFPAREVPFLNYFLDIQQILTTGQGKIDLFSHPKSFENGWDWIQGQVNRLLSQTVVGTSGSLAKQLKNSSPLSKILALKVMKELVDTYDLSVKAMKASSAWSKEEQVRLFKKMLKTYLDLLLDWGKNIADPTVIPVNFNWPLPKYLNKMNELFESKPDNDISHLLPSKSFSVVGAMIGSSTNFERNYPLHLEDIFTLIHQNLLAILSSNSNQQYDDNTLKRALLPGLLKEILKEVNPDTFNERVQRLSLEIEDEAVIVKYNIPVANHAVQLWIQYDKHSDEVIFKGFFLGVAYERWEKSGFLLWALDKFDLLPLSEPVHIDSRELRFSWKIKDFKTFHVAREELKFLLDMSRDLDLEKNLLKNLIDRQKPTKQSMDAFWSSVSKERDLKTIMSNHPSILQGLLSQNDHEINLRLAKAAFEGIKDKGPLNRLYSVDLIQDLANKGECLDIAETMAEELIVDLDARVRHKSMKLLITLIKYNKGHEAARKGVKVGILDKDSSVRSETIDLYIALVSSVVSDDGCRNEAAVAAETGIIDEIPDIRSKAIYLSGTLAKVRKDYVPKAIMVANNGIIDTDPTVRLSASSLFEDLVKMGEGFAVATEAAIKGLMDSDWEVRLKAIDLFKALFQQKQGYAQAELQASELIVSKNAISLDSGARLFRALFNSDQGYRIAMRHPVIYMTYRFS